MPNDAPQLERARSAYLRGTFFGDDAALDASLDELAALDRAGSLEPALLLEYGKLLHARSLARGSEQPDERAVFARALAALRQAGDERGEAETLFWQGLCVQLFDDDPDGAEPLLQAAYDTAVGLGDDLTRSYAARHLGFVAAARGQLDDARPLLEESLGLRRALGDFPAGEAAALLALAELEHESGDETKARDLLDEAHEIASRIGATRVQHWIAAARSEAVGD